MGRERERDGIGTEREWAGTGREWAIVMIFRSVIVSK